MTTESAIKIGKQKSLLQRYWLKGLAFIVLIQQSVYFGYRMGKDDGCLGSVDCVSKLDQNQRLLDAPSPSSNKNQVKRGIVLTSQCSGSEWIVSSLNNVPGVTWHLERMIRYSRTYMSESEWQQISWQTYEAELEQAFTTPPEDEGGAPNPEVTPVDPNDTKPPIMVGFKLMYDQIPQQLRLQFAEWLEQHQVYVVHLRRKCAALQFASQMDKYMRKYRQNVKKDHIYSKAEADALPKKDWEITLLDSSSTSNNRWLQNVKDLEDNQDGFARFLHVYAAQSPVFEFTYESVDGPFQENWFNALYAFLGFHHFRYQPKPSKTVKTGQRTCEDRMVGLGGPTLPLLRDTNSHAECLRMRALANVVAGKASATALKNATSVAILRASGVTNNLLLPPSDGRCRLGPNCKQRDYGKYQDAILSKTKQGQLQQVG